MIKSLNEYNMCQLSSSFSNLKLADDVYVELDLGCGKGSFTTLLAKKYPSRQIFAADVLIGRLRKLAKRNIRQDVNNISLIKAEAWHLIGRGFSDDSIDRVHILCPDPWPKHRHKHNRLISSEFIGRLSRKLKPNGIFHFSTDDNEYYNYTAKTVYNTGLFTLSDQSISDIAGLKSDFEIHWQEMGLKVRHISWKKVNLRQSRIL